MLQGEQTYIKTQMLSEIGTGCKQAKEKNPLGSVFSSIKIISLAEHQYLSA